MVYRQKKSRPDIQSVDFMFKAQRVETTDGKVNDKKLWFDGVAATESLDQQGERTLMDGLDLSYFLEHGWFDDGHSKAVKDGLGRPTEAKVIKQDNGHSALYVKGYFYDTPKNRELYSLMMAVEDAGDTGVIGLSVYGPVESRSFDKKIIKKALVRNCAITRNPVNTETYIKTMRKSFDVMVKALDVGTSVDDSTVSGVGGGAATLLKNNTPVVGRSGSQSPLGGKDTMKMQIIKADWDAMTDVMQKSITDAAAANEFEIEFVEAAVSVMEKSLGECTDEMVKALADAKETWAKDGVVATFSTEQINDIDTAFKSQNEALTSVCDNMAKSIDVQANHNTMISDLGGKMASLETMVTDNMGKLLDAMRQPGMSKALNVPNINALAPKPGDEVVAEDMVSIDEATGAMKKAFEGAVDPATKATFKSMYDRVAFSGFKGTKAQLNDFIAAVNN